jgi:hypothetical protein
VALSDGEKERLLQKASVTLLGMFASIMLRSVIAIAVAAVPLFGLQAAGLLDVVAAFDFLASWPGVLLTSTVMIGTYFIKVRS